MQKGYFKNENNSVKFKYYYIPSYLQSEQASIKASNSLLMS